MASQDLPGHRPEVVFIGRVNSGKSSMINAARLFEAATALKSRIGQSEHVSKAADFFVLFWIWSYFMIKID